MQECWMRECWMAKDRINWESDVACPCPEVWSLLKYFRKLGYCLSILRIFKYTIRSPTLPIANFFSGLWWNWLESSTQTSPRVSGDALFISNYFSWPLSSDWGLFHLSDENRSSAVTESQCLSRLFAWHCTVCPGRLLPCPINTNVSGRALVLSFPMSPSSLLAVTSRYYSYWYIPVWHFSLAMCPCAVISLADSSTPIISKVIMLLWFYETVNAWN